MEVLLTQHITYSANDRGIFNGYPAGLFMILLFSYRWFSCGCDMLELSKVFNGLETFGTLQISKIHEDTMCFLFSNVRIKSVAIELVAMIFYAMLVVVLFCLLIPSKTDADLFTW